MKNIPKIFLLAIFILICEISFSQGGFVDLDAIEYAPDENYVTLTDANGIQQYVPATDLIPVIFSDPSKVANIQLVGTNLQYDVVKIDDGTLLTTINVPLQSILTWTNLSGIPSDIADGDDVDDADPDPDNETISQLVLRTGGANPGQTVFEIHEAGQIHTMDFSPLQDGVDDADNDPTNELTQSINLVGNELRLVNQPLGLPLTADLSSLQEDYTFVKKITSLSDTSNLVCDSIFLDASFIGISCDTAFVRNTNTNTSILTEDYTANAAHTQSFENFGQTWNNLGNWNIDQSNSLFPNFFATMEIVNGGFNVTSNGAAGVNTELINKPNEFAFIALSGTESAKLHYLPAGQLILEKTTTTAAGDDVSLSFQNGEIGLNFGVDSDFKLDGDNGTLDQVFSSNGANAPPSWKDIPTTPDEWEIVEHFNTDFDPNVDYTGNKEFISVINTLTTPFDIINLSGDDVPVNENQKVNLTLFDGSWYAYVVPVLGYEDIHIPIELTSNTTVSPGIYSMNADGGSFTIFLDETVGEWVFGDPEKSTGTNAVSIGTALQNFTDLNGDLQPGPYVVNLDFTTFELWNYDGSNNFHVNYEPASGPSSLTPIAATQVSGGNVYWDGTKFIFHDTEILPLNGDVNPDGSVTNSYQLRTSTVPTQNVNTPVNYNDGNILEIQLRSQSGVPRSIAFSTVYKNPDGTEVGTIQLPPLEEHKIFFTRTRSSGADTWHVMKSSIATQASGGSSNSIVGYHERGALMTDFVDAYSAANTTDWGTPTSKVISLSISSLTANQGTAIAAGNDLVIINETGVYEINTSVSLFSIFATEEAFFTQIVRLNTNEVLSAHAEQSDIANKNVSVSNNWVGTLNVGDQIVMRSGNQTGGAYRSSSISFSIEKK